MNPAFDTLYFSEKGYLLRNNEEGFYQLGFFSFILAMNADEFKELCKVVAEKIADKEECLDDYARTCVIPTPFNGMQLVLTRRELEDMVEILEKSCDEKGVIGG